MLDLLGSPPCSYTLCLLLFLALHSSRYHDSRLTAWPLAASKLLFSPLTELLLLQSHFQFPRTFSCSLFPSDGHSFSFLSWHTSSFSKDINCNFYKVLSSFLNCFYFLQGQFFYSTWVSSSTLWIFLIYLAPRFSVYRCDWKAMWISVGSFPECLCRFVGPHLVSLSGQSCLRVLCPCSFRM